MSTVKDGEIGVDSGEHKKKTAALPSGNLLQFAIEHGPFSSLIFPLKMVIFHSSVSLPEGKQRKLAVGNNQNICS